MLLERESVPCQGWCPSTAEQYERSPQFLLDRVVSVTVYRGLSPAPFRPLTEVGFRYDGRFALTGEPSIVGE